MLFLLTVLLWADALFFPEKLITGQGFEGFPLIQKFILACPHVSVIASIVLLYLQAVMLNAVVSKHRLVERNQLLTAAIYVIIVSNRPEMIQPTVMLAVNFLLILTLNVVLKLYDTTESLSALFDVGFLVGVASLLYFPTISFLLFIVAGLIVFRLYYWRAWTIPILGFLSPYLFVMTWYFWFGRFIEEYEIFISRFDFQMPVYSGVAPSQILIWGLLAILILLGFGKVIKLATEGTVDSRKKSRVLILMFLVAMVSSFFSGQSLTSHIYLELIPVVVYISSYISRLKKIFVVELIFTVLFIAILAFKILNFS